jgi:hypothetical protein
LNNLGHPIQKAIATVMYVLRERNHIYAFIIQFRDVVFNSNDLPVLLMINQILKQCHFHAIRSFIANFLF